MSEYHDRLWVWFIEALEECGQTISLDEVLRNDMRYALARTVEQEQQRADEERAKHARVSP
jgi:hypothetical protein